MKISIVIPTRNRLHLLKQAIASVIRQADRDWELIVYDNASDVSPMPFVASLEDPRIIGCSSLEFHPVTSSWNNAINIATGDYVILIGDDDGLSPGYLSRAQALVKMFGSPDIVYSAFYQFVHPGVAPWQLAGYVDENRNASFFEGHDAPYVVDPRDARTAVAGSLDVQRDFMFNMQAFLFKKTFLDELRRDGEIFHSPFPDYYLANYAIQKASRIVADPVLATVAGVSSASFGFTLLNGMDTQGAALLKSDIEADPLYAQVSPLILPGPAYNTNYILTMAHVRSALGDSAPGTVNYPRYRKIQIRRFLEGEMRRLRWMRSPAGQRLWSKLTWRERVWATVFSYLEKEAVRKGSPGALLKKMRRIASHHDHELSAVRRFTGDFATLPELLTALDAEPAW